MLPFSRWLGDIFLASPALRLSPVPALLLMLQVTEGPSHTINHFCFTVCFTTLTDGLAPDHRHSLHRPSTYRHFYPITIDAYALILL